MKKPIIKPLLIISIITTILAVIAFCYAAIMFGTFVQGMKNDEAGAEVFGLLFFIIFNMFTFILTSVNLIPNIIHFIKCRKVVVIILFALACALFALSSAGGLYIIIKQ